jgi:hypothetical protein
VDDGIRTRDNLSHSQELYQLSYIHRHVRIGAEGAARYGRGDRIRTYDPLLPKQVRYQLRYAPRS